MTKSEILQILPKLCQASIPGKVEDGTRVHIQYESIGPHSDDAKRAKDLGLDVDRYTGRVSRIWKSGNNHQMLTLFVELERDHKFRSFNLDLGEVKQIVVLGD